VHFLPAAGKVTRSIHCSHDKKSEAAVTIVNAKKKKIISNKSKYKHKQINLLLGSKDFLLLITKPL
jgi:hypothetical protein